MYLEWLQIGHVRNLENIRFEPGPGLNVFTGRNAAGKTAFLESIYLLARARSFRTPRIQEVVSRGHEFLQVSARAGYRASAFRVNTGIEKGRGRVLIRYNGSPVRTVSTQARSLPLVLVTPDSHELVSGGPKQRRHWLDWAMFHVEPSYLEDWREYMKALRHRNRLLKEGRRDAELYRGWEQAMARAGEAVQRARQGFLDDLQARLAPATAACFPGEVAVSLEGGWPAGSALQEWLAQERAADQAAGFSRGGPHRADVRFSSDGIPLAAQFSRGQIKLFVCLLMMAEAQLLEGLTGEPPVFLLDDYAAELDAQAGAGLLHDLASRGWQTFITATTLATTGDLPGPLRRFHVEHGTIAKVVE